MLLKLACVSCELLTTKIRAISRHCDCSAGREMSLTSTYPTVVTKSARDVKPLSFLDS